MCDLFVESPTYAKVGSGLVFKQEGHKVHKVPLKSNEVQVCLKEVVAGHEETPLPLQNAVSEIYTVGDAKGTFVVWPLVLVSLQNKVSEEVRSKEKSVDQSVTPYAKNKPAYPREGDLGHVACYHICMAFNVNNNKFDSISVLMPEAFWGTAFTDHVGLENIREVLKLGWLSASSISLYIKYLCDIYLVHEEDNAQCGSRNQLPSRYSFTSPHIVAGHTHIVDVLQKHEGQDHLVMIPYNIEHHWVLVAINTMSENIYYMDPLRVHHTHPQRKRLEHMIKSAMNSYWANKRGGVSSGKRLRQIQWFNIECPKQDVERGCCGYYICDIPESEATTVPAAYVQKRRCKTFSDDRIEHVQREWCGYLYNRFLKDIINSGTR